MMRVVMSPLFIRFYSIWNQWRSKNVSRVSVNVLKINYEKLAKILISICSENKQFSPLYYTRWSTKRTTLSYIIDQKMRLKKSSKTYQ